MPIRRWLRVSVLAMLLALPWFSSMTTAQEAAELKINSTAYIVVDADTGYVFAQRNAHERVAIASVTKVFTAVQAMEMAPLDTVIVTRESDLIAPDGTPLSANGTVMGFSAGQEYTLEDLIYGMLLPSGNDASNAVARALGYQEGDTDEEAVQRFLDLMNQRVVDMGLTDTHFMNAHGWGVEGHYSTASDVAAFGRLVANYPRLMEIMGTRSYTTSNGLLSFNNSNKSLSEFPSVFAGKTGYDWDAGYCLINFATRDSGANMIAVTLNGIGPGDWYDDNATLLDYGFDQQAALLASGEPFDGDVAAFTNPGPAEVARSTSSEGGFGVSEGLEAPVQEAPVVEDPVVGVAEDPVVEQGSAQSQPNPAGRIGAGAVWVAAITALGVLALRGMAVFGSSQGAERRPEPNVETEETIPAVEVSLDQPAG